MKKSFLTLLMTTSLLTMALTGCAEKDTEPAQKEEQTKTTTPDLNNGEKQDDKNQDAAEQTPTPEDDPSHKEIQEAFGLGDYRTLNPMQIAAIGLGQMELPLDEQQRLALAKAMTSAMGKSGWQQGDLPPAIYMSSDGSKFAVGMKKSDGALVLERYELQANGAYKSIGTETK